MTGQVGNMCLSTSLSDGTLPPPVPATLPSQAPRTGTLQNPLVPSTPGHPRVPPTAAVGPKGAPKLGAHGQVATHLCFWEQGWRNRRHCKTESLPLSTWDRGNWALIWPPASQAAPLGHCSLRGLTSKARRRETTSCPRKGRLPGGGHLEGSRRRSKIWTGCRGERPGLGRKETHTSPWVLAVGLIPEAKTWWAMRPRLVSHWVSEGGKKREREEASRGPVEVARSCPALPSSFLISLWFLSGVFSSTTGLN